jgi:nicotinamide mononucleotide transporter
MDSLKEFLASVQLDFIQLAALILGVTEVLLARANNVWLYPTGISAIILSVFSLFNAQLYADSILHLYYLVMSIYGWWYWVTKHNNEPVRVTFSTRRELNLAVGIVAGAWLALYLFLISFTPSEQPIWDSWVSATGWAGMWLLARRKVENWIFLNISNAFAIPLLFHKDLALLAILTIVLFAVACKGYFDWKKIAQAELQVAQA